MKKKKFFFSEKKLSSSFKFQREKNTLENQEMDWEMSPGINTFFWNCFSWEDCQISQSHMLNLLWDYFVLFFCKENRFIFSQFTGCCTKSCFQVRAQHKAKLAICITRAMLLLLPLQTTWTFIIKLLHNTNFFFPNY